MPWRSSWLWVGLESIIAGEAALEGQSRAAGDSNGRRP
jgi:hypothetical protein